MQSDDRVPKVFDYYTYVIVETAFKQREVKESDFDPSLSHFKNIDRRLKWLVEDGIFEIFIKESGHQNKYYRLTEKGNIIAILMGMISMTLSDNFSTDLNTFEQKVRDLAVLADMRSYGSIDFNSKSSTHT